MPSIEEGEDKGQGQVTGNAEPVESDRDSPEDQAFDDERICNRGLDRLFGKPGNDGRFVHLQLIGARSNNASSEVAAGGAPLHEPPAVGDDLEAQKARLRRRTDSHR